ncbi:hypothetical protein Pelo_10027 [Pelomyxa schiedti]|nr:hypothetical protein Pelo_10027 [Pelomyxa schiedti]
MCWMVSDLVQSVGSTFLFSEVASMSPLFVSHWTLSNPVVSTVISTSSGVLTSRISYLPSYVTQKLVPFPTRNKFLTSDPALCMRRGAEFLLMMYTLPIDDLATTTASSPSSSPEEPDLITSALKMVSPCRPIPVTNHLSISWNSLLSMDFFTSQKSI